MNPISICIPKIENDITQSVIFNAFKALEIGFIDKITILTNKTTTSRRAFIKFKYMFKTDKTEEICKILKNDEYINVMYDFPHYWKCYLSKF